jgi:hypothetical protein
MHSRIYGQFTKVDLGCRIEPCALICESVNAACVFLLISSQAAHNIFKLSLFTIGPNRAEHYVPHL